jgi:hypothetical protein
MLSVHIENIGEMAIIECEGRIVRSEAALELRKAVNLQSDARHSVRDRLEHASSMREFDIATLDEMMALLACADGRYTRAA